MDSKRLRIILALATTLLVIAALAAESFFFSDFEYRFRTERFNKVLAEKELLLTQCLDQMKPLLAAENHHGAVKENNIFSLAAENGITILEYLDDKLNYWSDNEFDVPVSYTDSLASKTVVFLQNGWFIIRTVHSSNEKIVGLLRLYTDYEFENEIISDGFADYFKMPKGVRLSVSPDASKYHIRNSTGDFLFSLVYPSGKTSTSFLTLPLVLWSSVFILFLVLVFSYSGHLVSAGRKKLAVAGSGFVFLLFYALLLLGLKGRLLSLTGLFSPEVFSLNALIPSLGHLLLLSILAATFSYLLFFHTPMPEREPASPVKDYLFLLPLMVGGAFLYTICTIIFARLVADSNISFETYRILDITGYSIAGFSAMILLMFVPLLFYVRIFSCVRKYNRKTVLLAILSSLGVPAVFFLYEPGTFVAVSLFYIVITFSLWLAGRQKAGAFNLSVIFSVLFGLFSFYLIFDHSEEKRDETLKIQAVGLSTENDPEAEQLILDLWPVLSKDTVLSRLMDVEYFTTMEYEAVADYLKKRYFTGYWRNFNLNIFLCRTDDPISIGEGRLASQNCFSFFEERLSLNGQKLTGTEFYFLENQGGRSFYTGKVVFKNKSGASNRLFIELFSDVNVFQPGYSELLLEKNYHGYASLRDYSFAKYINGRAVLRTGNFPYNDTDADYLVADTEFRTFSSEGVKHLLYRNGNATVLISRPEVTFSEAVISFAYLFAYIFIFFNIMVAIFRPPSFKGAFSLNLRRKMQLAFIGVLLFSFVIVGVVVATFTIEQYKTKLYDTLKEKVSSIYLELDSRIASEKRLTADWRNINYESLGDILINFSNIFMTDINVFDAKGFLIATSRPEIFNRDLASRRMNNMAMISLMDLTRSEFFQREKIGKLEYLSAYVPFYNTDNDVIAFLNLPYFRMQSVLAREISNLIVAVVNFTLFMVILTMSLAVIISGRLTAPLSMLGKALASVEVGKKSEHLSYGGTDEIAELVKQYNRMVDEIDESSRRLADSEREFAWREMARQIAHEIKNPLTPMRLNVQQLLKSWKDKAPGFDRQIEKFSDNQIEYIDNLSNIASAFSSFARMPETTFVEVNLLDQVKSTLDLYRNSENVDFTVKWPADDRVMICADREQLNGIFSNLFKNAIQSIPDSRKGLINTTVEISGNKVLIMVSDNGTGIPEELQKRMFTPNFTTKSSGMGLGLSIVKKYVESFNGRIWYASEPDKGTTFFVEFPLLKSEEKPA